MRRRKENSGLQNDGYAAYAWFWKLISVLWKRCVGNARIRDSNIVSTVKINIQKD